MCQFPIRKLFPLPRLAARCTVLRYASEARDMLIERMGSEIEHLRTQLEEAHESNRENRRIIAGLVQRVPELEAAPERRESPEAASEERGSADAPPEDQGGEKPAS